MSGTLSLTSPTWAVNTPGHSQIPSADHPVAMAPSVGPPRGSALAAIPLTDAGPPPADTIPHAGGRPPILICHTGGPPGVAPVLTNPCWTAPPPAPTDDPRSSRQRSRSPVLQTMHTLQPDVAPLPVLNENASFDFTVDMSKVILKCKSCRRTTKPKPKWLFSVTRLTRNIPMI